MIWGSPLYSAIEDFPDLVSGVTEVPNDLSRREKIKHLTFKCGKKENLHNAA